MNDTTELKVSFPHVFSCRVCGHEGSARTYQVQEMMFGTRDKFKYFMCGSCGCLQIVNIPEDLSIYYPKEYYSHQLASPTPRHGMLFKILERLLVQNALFQQGFKLSRIANKYAALPVEFFRARPKLLQRAGVRDFRAAILDIGCGSQAEWLQDLRSIGFRNLMGIDPLIEADLNQGVLIRRVEATLFANQSGRTFDLITLHHSLEHIPDQLGTLKAVRTLLSPTGTCVVRIPTVSSLAWDKYGVNWVELDAPRHLYLHSKESLQNLAKKADLELFDIQYDTTSFEFYGSEQYLLDVPLTSPQSLWHNPNSTLFSYEKQREFEAQAKQVNADGTAGRACFFFRHSISAN